MAVYQFDTDHAARWGVNEAIFLQNLIHWLRKNKAEGRNIRVGEDGVHRVWSYSSTEALARLFAFWKPHQVRYIIDSLRKQEVIVTDHFPEHKFDRRLWFAVTNEALLELSDVPELSDDESDEDRNARFAKFRKSKGEKSQIESPKVADGTADSRNSLTDRKTRLKEPDVTAADIAAPPDLFSASTVLDGHAAADPKYSERVSDLDLVSRLADAGLNQTDAKRLASSHPDECCRQLEFLPFITSFKSSRGAYLRSAIEQGFAPPQGWVEAQRKATAAADKQKKQSVVYQAQRDVDAKAEQERAALEAEKQRLQTEHPDLWARIVAEAEAQLPPPLRGKTSHVAYAGALSGNIERLLSQVSNSKADREAGISHGSN